MRRHTLILLALLALPSMADAQRPAPPKHLPGFEYHVGKDGAWWWRKMHPDNEKPDWIYYAKPIAPQTATDSPLAFGRPEQFIAFNSGVNIQAMMDGPSKPGFSAGGGGSFTKPDTDAEPAPAPEQPLTFPEFLRKKWGVDPVVFFAAVGALAFLVFVLFILLVVLLVVALRRR